jgi:hypothetical protein
MHSKRSGAFNVKFFMGSLPVEFGNVSRIIKNLLQNSRTICMVLHQSFHICQARKALLASWSWCLQKQSKAESSCSWHQQQFSQLLLFPDRYLILPLPALYIMSSLMTAKTIFSVLWVISRQLSDCNIYRFRWSGITYWPPTLSHICICHVNTKERNVTSNAQAWKCIVKEVEFSMWYSL